MKESYLISSLLNETSFSYVAFLILPLFSRILSSICENHQQSEVNDKLVYITKIDNKVPQIPSVFNALKYILKTLVPHYTNKANYLEVNVKHLFKIGKLIFDHRKTD